MTEVGEFKNWDSIRPTGPTLSSSALRVSEHEPSVLARDQASDGFVGEVLYASYPAGRSDNCRELCFSADWVAGTLSLGALSVGAGFSTVTPA